MNVVTPRKLPSTWPSQSAQSLPPLPDFSSRTFPILSGECCSLKFTPSGRWLLAGFTDGTCRAFDLIHSMQYILCQIRPKGVHSRLTVEIDVAPDGLWAFCGVLRGSMELVAIALGDLEDTMDDPSKNVWKHVRIFRHTDAKLRGFGACTRLQASETYLLLTGKSIKNIHVWSFVPSSPTPKWTEIYNTPTNGATITYLAFRHTADGHLHAWSKSEAQKLRVWDLSHEQDNANGNRPLRPPFRDVEHTEACLGVVGSHLALCGGESWYPYPQLRIVTLDPNLMASDYNHTELALPEANTTAPPRRRGALQWVRSVTGTPYDDTLALVELSDGSLWQYHTQLIEITRAPTTERTLARVGPDGRVLVAWARDQQIQVQTIAEAPPSTTGFWGFLDRTSNAKDIGTTSSSTKGMKRKLDRTIPPSSVKIARRKSDSTAPSSTVKVTTPHPGTTSLLPSSAIPRRNLPTTVPPSSAKAVKKQQEFSGPPSSAKIVARSKKIRQPFITPEIQRQPPLTPKLRAPPELARSKTPPPTGEDPDVVQKIVQACRRQARRVAVRMTQKSTASSEHAAVQDRMRSKVYRTTWQLLQSVLAAPSTQSLHRAHKVLAETMQAYQIMTEEMIARQSLEAEVWEFQPKRCSDTTKVEFAYPEIFREALDFMPQL